MSIPTLLALSIALHLYIGARIVPALPMLPGALFALLLLASAVLAPTGLLARRLARPPRADTLAWIGLPFLGLFSSLFVLTLLRDGLLLTLWLASLLVPGILSLADAGPRDGRSRAGARAGGDFAGLCQCAAPGPRRHGSPSRSRTCPRRCTASPSSRSATSTSGPPSASATSKASSRPSITSSPTWWPSPATWSTAACPNWAGRWRRCDA